MNKFLIAFTVCLGIFSGCAVVNPGERAVKVSMGELNKNLMQPGVSFYNPLTDGVTEYSIKQDSVDGTAAPLTRDQQPITINYKVLYRVPEHKILDLYSQYKGDPYETLVAPQIQEAFRQVVSQYKADAATQSVNKIKGQVLSMTRDNLRGLVEVNDIPITHIELPEALKAAISDKQVMEQKALKKAYELDAARREASITVTNAEAQARSIQLQSQALAKSPQLIEYEKAKKWDGKLPTTMVNGGGHTIFQLK